MFCSAHVPAATPLRPSLQSTHGEVDGRGVEVEMKGSRLLWTRDVLLCAIQIKWRVVGGSNVEGTREVLSISRPWIIIQGRWLLLFFHATTPPPHQITPAKQHLKALILSSHMADGALHLRGVEGCRIYSQFAVVMSFYQSRLIFGIRRGHHASNRIL